MRKIIFLLILLFSFSSNMALANFDAGLQPYTHDNIERNYYLYTPETDINSLLIVLHPAGSNGRAMQYVTGLNELADTHGFAVAYPDAGNYYWDDGRMDAGMPPEFGSFDDVGFITGLAESLRDELEIEEVYLAGLENGGSMAYRIACEVPEQFEAIISVSAMLWDYQVENCGEASAPVNMLIINGENHPHLVPEGEDIEYLSSGAIFAWLGWQDSVNIWRERNNCADSDASVLENDLSIYSDCDDNTSVSFWSIPHAGYNWARMANNTINRFGVDISEVIASYMSGDDWQTLTQPAFASTILARSWIIYIPSTYDDSTPAPLVLNLHGRHSTASAQAYTSDFNRIAEEEGVIVLYPNGIDTQWNYLHGIFAAGPPPYSDEAFIRSLIEDLDIDLNIDRNRMYVTGLSNGGFMTQRLACTMQDQFAAFASVAATAPLGIEQMCEDTDPVPLMYIHGTDDRIVLWSGNIEEDSVGTRYYMSYPMEQSVNFWGIHNQCSSEYTAEPLPIVDPETTTAVLTLSDCAPDSTVILYGVSGGGHVWHGTRVAENDLTGQSSQDFNSTDVIWEFFNRYTLDGQITQ